jgi:threonine dehydratase
VAGEAAGARVAEAVVSGGPQTKREWQEAADALAEARTVGPEEFPCELGVDAESLREWAADDAVDSLAILLNGYGVSVPPSGSVEMAGMLATHFQIGVEMGLWLVKTGQVQP